MQISKALTISLCLFLSFSGFTQSQHVHYCGTSKEDQMAIMADFEANREAIFSNTIRNGAVTYIPIKFHLVGESDGSGQVTSSVIYNLFCVLNRDYEPYDIQFYLQGGIVNGIRYLNDSRVYDDPNSSTSQNILRNRQLANRNAINVFINSTVQKDEPGVLGRFYREDDYIILANSEAIGAKSSLSHEIGHFFGLSHTFYGWEITEYDCNLPTPTTVYLGAFGVPVEYVDRNRNCFQAADQLCDTPADYNLGLGYSGPCDFQGCAKDPDGVKVVPQTENMMGYFLTCISVFSGQQVAVMIQNYNSSPREYLRENYTPSLVEITEEPVLVSPADRATTPYFDEVTLDWEPVAGAQGYIVAVDRAPNFSTGLYESITDLTEISISGIFNPGQRYYWRVTPISEYQNCASPSDRYQFTTSQVMTNTNDLIDGINRCEIVPNPSTESLPSFIEIEGDQSGKMVLQIFSVNGIQMLEKEINVVNAEEKISLPSNLNAGTYMVRLMNDKGDSLLRKWLITE